MKSKFFKKALGLTVCLIAVSTLTGPSVAESIENQCRAAARAEIKGPNCRIANPRSNSLSVDPCGIPTGGGAQGTMYMNKVAECVAHGGPGGKTR
jgi:hypothetical protein